ncbi:polysaccharide pyruvyl transferase family protein [Streptococcus henryi]
MKKKITITNAYTWYNKGDAGILLGTVNTLKQIYGSKNIEIDILSFTPSEDKKRYCKDPVIKNVYSNVLNPRPYKHTKIGKLIAIVKLIVRTIYLSLMMKINLNKLVLKEEAFKSLSDSDLIVVCGGGFLGGKKLDSLMHVFQMHVNTKFNKPVYLMGTSIEPMTNRIVKFFTDGVLKKLDFIFARETITFDYLKTLIPSNKFTLIPDMAFMLEDINEEFEAISDLKKNEGPVYGLTVREWNFPNFSNPTELMSNYIFAIRDVIEEQVKKNNASFVFVPQVIVKHGDDAEVALKIKSLLRKEYQDRFLVLRDDISPVQVKAMIANFDYFIGTRMHSNIFATSMKVPTIAIAYEKKTNGIMHTVNLDDYVIEMNEVTSEKLNNLIEKQSKNNELIRKQLNKVIPEIRNEVLEKMKAVLK